MSKESDVGKVLSRLLGWPVNESDGQLEGVPGWCVQVRRQGKIGRDHIRRWWREAVDRAALADRLPALLYRARGGEWRAVFPWCALNDQRPEDWQTYDLTSEVSLVVLVRLLKELRQNVHLYSAVACHVAIVRH